MPLDPPTAARLTKLLGMTSSTYDNEALSAVRMANQLLKSAGLTWSDVIAHDPDPVHAEWREPDNWRAAVRQCMEMTDVLTTWDVNFLCGILYADELSPKQQRQLARIMSTCRMSRRAA